MGRFGRKIKKKGKRELINTLKVQALIKYREAKAKGILSKPKIFTDPCQLDLFPKSKGK